MVACFISEVAQKWFLEAKIANQAGKLSWQNEFLMDREIVMQMGFILAMNFFHLLMGLSHKSNRVLGRVPTTKKGKFTR